MKKYDRDKRAWVTLEEYERTHKHRDKEFCKGKKPHDFVLVLPEHVTYNSTYQHNPEAYYDLLDEYERLEEEIDAKIKAMGVVERWSRVNRWHRNARLYLCSVCHKKHHEYKDSD